MLFAERLSRWAWGLPLKRRFLFLDTIGDGTNWNFGTPSGQGGPVGFDPFGGIVPAVANKAAYGALPFTVNALPTGASKVDSIDVALAILPGNGDGATSNIPALRGVIFSVPAGATALNAAGVTKIGASFSFDTTFSRDAGNPSSGNGLVYQLTSTNASTANITLQVGKTYWLVLEPKDGLVPTSADTLLDVGVWQSRLVDEVTGSAAQLTNAYTTVSPALDTYSAGSGGNANTLVPVTVGRTTKFSTYFGAIVRLTAPSTGATVSGRIALEGVSDLTKINAAFVNDTYHVEFRTPNTTTVIKSADVTLTPVGANSPFGTFSVSGVAPGVYDIALKGSKTLRIVQKGVTIGGSTATLADVTLPGGNADGNDTVDIGDFGVLVNAYGGVIGATGTNYLASADFNDDGTVDIADFGILVNEYGNTGPQ